MSVALPRETCRDCGHVRHEHTKVSGNFWFDGCAHGAELVYGYYLVGGCECLTFVRKPWWQRMFDLMKEEK